MDTKEYNMKQFAFEAVVMFILNQLNYVLSALFFCIDNCIFTSQEFTNHYALL